MSKAQHTPAPWTYRKGWEVIVDEYDEPIAELYGMGHDRGSRDANGFLAAAAPELLALCEAAYDLLQSGTVGGLTSQAMVDLDSLEVDLEIALARAKGKGVPA